MLFMDLATSQRLERTEGGVAVSFVETVQRIEPETHAAFEDFGGTYAIFDGVESPMTQTFGLGLFAPTTPELLAEIEAFFQQRGAMVSHEVSPLAGIETPALLVERGYRPIELGTVLVRPIGDAPDPVATDLGVRRCAGGDTDWMETSVAGWAETVELEPVIRTITRRASANAQMRHFVVERAGAMIATGSLGVHEGVALLAGASTIPAGRGLGAQGLLLAARLAEARRAGCDLAMMVATPGTTSQRNAERRGFRVAYTRTKWQLDRPAGVAH